MKIGPFILPDLYGLATVYTAANAVNAAIPFLLLPILTRVLSPADYGIAAMFGLVVSILGAAAGLNVAGSIGVRYFQLEQERLRDYVGTCLWIVAVSSAIVFVVVLTFGPPIAAITGVPPSWIPLAAVMAASQALISIVLISQQVRGQAVRYGAMQIGQSILNVGLSLVLVLVFAMTWRGRILAQVIASILFAGVSMTALRRANYFSRRVNAQDLRSALAFGVPLIPHVVGALLIATVDRFMISAMISIAQAGIYTVALQIGMIVALLTDSFNRAYAPWLMKNLAEPNARRDITIVRGTYLYFVLLILLACLVGLISGPILNEIAGTRFHSASSYVIFIAAGYAFGGMYYMVTNYIFFANKTFLLAGVTLMSGVFNIAATYFLIKINGAVGAAQAFMASQALLFLGTWILASRVRPMPWRKALVRHQANR